MWFRHLEGHFGVIYAPKVATELSPGFQPWDWSLDIWKGALGVIYALKVATGLSPGFQPWAEPSSTFGARLCAMDADRPHEPTQAGSLCYATLDPKEA